MRRRTIRRAQQAERLTGSVPSLRDSSPQTKSRMKKKFRPYFVALVICLPYSLGAQEKQRFSSFDEAAQASGILAGRRGPEDVNWIEGGKRFSYTGRDASTGAPVIRAYDPATGRDTLLFSTAGLTL